jgi:hypothetical protein
LRVEVQAEHPIAITEVARIRFRLGMRLQESKVTRMIVGSDQGNRWTVMLSVH